MLNEGVHKIFGARVPVADVVVVQAAAIAGSCCVLEQRRTVETSGDCCYGAGE